MIALILALVAVLALAVLISFELARLRERQLMARRQPRRSAELEESVGDLLAGPTHKYGEIFTEFAVWRGERETRLELRAGTPWKRLNEFTRCLIVRYLWRSLERMSEGAVVVVDVPAQRWTAEVDTRFDDHGFDWHSFGPQFVKEP